MNSEYIINNNYSSKGNRIYKAILKDVQYLNGELFSKINQ